MSRIGKLPVAIPNGVTVKISGQQITVTGPKGTLDFVAPHPISVTETEGQIIVSRPNDERKSKALHGLSRTLIQNTITGVVNGYKLNLEIHGVGYRVKADKDGLEFALGYSHPINVSAPAGITFSVESPTKFSIEGIDKQKVGQVAANIKRLRKQDPYKGKGIRLEGEQVRRKVGKAGK